MDWDKVERDLERTQRRIDDPRTPREEALNLIASRGTLRRLLKSRTEARRERQRGARGCGGRKGAESGQWERFEPV